MWGGEPNTGEPNTSNHNNNDNAAPNDWVDQSWQSNAPRTQATTRTNQSDSHHYNDDDEDYGDLPDARSDDEEDYAYATQSWSTPPPRYDTVPKPESLWQPYNMPQYKHAIETIDQHRHLGTFGMKPPYRFGTHEDDPLATEYIKLEPSVLTIALRAMAGQRANHEFLSEHHAVVVTKTNAAITKLSRTINIDSWGRTAPVPYETMRSAPDTSFDEHGNAGGKPSYKWYTKIEVACQNFRKNPRRLATLQRRARLGIPKQPLRT